VFLRAFAPDTRPHAATRRRNGDPYPGITVGCAPQRGGCQGVFLGMHNAPYCIPLPCGHRQVLPRVPHAHSAWMGGPVQPGTHGIVSHWDQPCGTVDGIARCQRPYRQCENGRGCFKVKIRGAVGQGDAPAPRTPQGLLFPVTAAILDQPPLPQDLTIIATGAIGTRERLPVQGILGKLTTHCSG
jgi:hypothetical protein